MITDWKKKRTAMVEQLRGVTLDLPPERQPLKLAIGAAAEPVAELAAVVAEAPAAPPSVEAAPPVEVTPVEAAPVAEAAPTDTAAPTLPADTPAGEEARDDA